MEISRPGILLLLPDLPIAETIDDVIVHHSNRLHVRINDRRANEAESPEPEVLAECVGFGRSRWNLPRSLPVVRTYLLLTYTESAQGQQRRIGRREGPKPT